MTVIQPLTTLKEDLGVLLTLWLKGLDKYAVPFSLTAQFKKTTGVQCDLCLGLICSIYIKFFVYASCI